MDKWNEYKIHNYCEAQKGVHERKKREGWNFVWMN